MLMGYLCGSIPFALLLGWSQGVDIRTVGSGNVGATNVGRTLGKKWGVVCLLLDVSKGLGPVLIAGGWLGLLHAAHPAASLSLGWLLVGVCAVLGHIFPVWLKFKGGKGVATALGVLLGFWPLLTIPGVGAVATWIVLAWFTRYISVASIGAAAVLPVYVLLMGLGWRQTTLGELWPFLLVGLAMAALVIMRHTANLVRLMSGREPKWGQGKKDDAVVDADVVADVVKEIDDNPNAQVDAQIDGTAGSTTGDEVEDTAAKA